MAARMSVVGLLLVCAGGWHLAWGAPLRPARPGPRRRVPKARPVVVTRKPVVRVVKTPKQLPVVRLPVPVVQTTSEGKTQVVYVSSAATSETDEADTSPAAATTAQSWLRDAPSYRVVRVTETLQVVLDMDGKETTVRLIGVEPFPAPSGAGGPPARGRMQWAFLENLLKGEYVCLAHDEDLEDTDEEGLLMGYVYRAPDMLFVNLELVRQGLGVTSTDYAFQHKPVFEVYEQRAQAEDKGLWARVNRSSTGAPPASSPGRP
jgi:endonuclease YncB( thermonuclease family)